MGKKPSKRRKQSVVVAQPPAESHLCPFCGIANREKSALSLMERFFQSHAELCVALRSAGRQLLRFEKQADQSLERIRRVLKRADTIRKALRIPNELPETLKSMDELSVVAPAPVSEYRAHAQRKTRPSRPHPQPILKFPTG
jgi:hypothetical protein